MEIKTYDGKSYMRITWEQANDLRKDVQIYEDLYGIRAWLHPVIFLREGFILGAGKVTSLEDAHPEVIEKARKTHWYIEVSSDSCDPNDGGGAGGTD